MTVSDSHNEPPLGDGPAEGVVNVAATASAKASAQASASDFTADDSTSAGRIVARVFALTDVGRIREHNEDTFLVAELETGSPLDFELGYHEITADEHGLLFLVADGMGGAASGELASSMAGSLVLEALRTHWSTSAPSGERFAEALRDATVNANTRIHQHARENPEHRGMGTTATVAGLLRDTLFMVQVGDSRAYLVRDGQAKQLTKDQSLMQRLVEAGELTPEEAEVSDRRNIILQALGPEANVTVDITHQQVRRGDTLLLCSDGLSGLVKGDEMAELAVSHPDVRALCRELIALANSRGGPDNITVIAVRFEGDGLEHTLATDSVGYRAYPLAGTLNDHTREIASLTPVPAVRSIRTDPTPKFGTKQPTREELRETYAKRPTPVDVPLVGATAPVLEERKRALQPVYVALGAAATAALLWTAWQLYRA
ncbi:MAG: serine/threonine-protein phosphatase [Gemmatimonadaceae bacterium]|nr:serine/threonine-protein phosphatase [Gemmatimonadaceae bacterium]